MKHALGPMAGDLADAARSRVVLAFDFDGTLAPLVADRTKAMMRPRTRDAIARLCTLYPCAVISGRARDDVARRLEGLPFRHVIGNHGIRLDGAHGEFEDAITVARGQLAILARSPGVEIEDKRHSIAIHYRHAPDRRVARRSIANALSTLSPTTRALHGKLVVDILPARAPSKGDALAAICVTEGADRALFVGDDRTDEDAFAHTDTVFGIRVGFSRRSMARYFVRDQREVDRLLAWLAAERTNLGPVISP